MLDEAVLAQITAAVQNLGEEITVGGIVHDEVNVVVLLDHSVEGNDVGVGRCQFMKGNFTDMELTLAGAAMYLRGDETLYSIVASKRVVGVDGAVHNAISSYAKDFCEFESVVVDKGTDGRRRGGFRRRLLGRHPNVCVP